MLYRITLKPTESFYFGGENSFGETKFKDDSEKSTSKNYFAKRSAYFAKGEMFPQQTQVLGMLRKEIMRKQGYLKLHNSGECIVKGKKQETINDVGLNWKENLGKIKQLFPLVLEKENDIFVPAPYDKELSLFRKKGSSYINGRKNNDVYAFKKDTDKDKFFGAKDSLCNAYISKSSSLELDDIFTSVTRIGNQTLGYNDDDEEQLYKMTSYILNPDVRFVSFLELEEDIFNCHKNEYQSFVELGGERSTFKLTISAETSMVSFAKIYNKYAKNENRIVLVSDTYVSNEVFTMIDVALANKISFRTITSNKYGFAKSSKIVLLAKGTVFFPKNGFEDTLCKEIEKEKTFRNIGYNQYVKIDKKEG